MTHDMKASDFDRKFDGGENVAAELDLSKVRRPAQEQRGVNVDSPAWMMRVPRLRGPASRSDPPIHHKGLDLREA